MRVRLILIARGPASWARLCLCLSLCLPLALPAHARRADPHAPAAEPPREAKRGVREAVPDKYLKKYRRWKAEYLSTGEGRRQWRRYADDERFTLTITVSQELGRGGIVSDYRWDEAGRLVGATITLGSGLDGGLPPTLYYPVTSALGAAEEVAGLSGDILAAAKLAHEFGHVNRAADTGAALFERQNTLSARYARLFEESGYNPRDPRVAEVTRLLGGTPFDIQLAREHGAEANTLAFLRERMSDESGRGALFRQIRKSVSEYGEKHPRQR